MYQAVNCPGQVVLRVSDRCLCGPGGQGWSDGDGQLFFDLLGRLRAGDAADFLALAQHDQGR